jgi:hypothetical protein
MNGFWHVCNPASSSLVHAAAMWMSSAACTLQKASSLESHSLAMPFMDSYPDKLLLQFNEDNMKFCDWLSLLSTS